MNLRIAVRVKSRILLIDPDDVECVEACGNYVRVHLRDAAHLVRGTISAFQQYLSSYGFVRVHRSSLVNIAHVVSLEPAVSGDYTVQMRSGRDVVLSRTFRERFFAFVSVPTANHPAGSLVSVQETS